MSGSPVESAPRSRSSAILTPITDLLCVGGLSLLVLVPLLLSGADDLGFLSLGVLVWAQLLINLSHFMASYRIIYRDREMILRHKWASIGVPVILLGFAAFALVEPQDPPVMLMGFFVVSSAYLAWHYTGQVWGMMASFAFLEGIRFEPGERRLVRAGLRILLAWHVAWFLNIWLSRTSVGLAQQAELAYRLLTAGGAVAFALGAAGLWRMTRRIGRLPPVRTIVPWLAIFAWYGAMLRWGLAGLFLAQLFHALQYLEFPARVELNRATRRAAGRALAHMAVYAVALVAISLLVSFAVPGPPMSLIASSLGVEPGKVAPILLFYFINIHHYFTDGVAWKLSNPEVRKELFAHLAPATVSQERPSHRKKKVKR